MYRGATQQAVHKFPGLNIVVATLWVSCVTYTLDRAYDEQTVLEHFQIFRRSLIPSLGSFGELVHKALRSILGQFFCGFRAHVILFAAFLLVAPRRPSPLPQTNW